MCHIETRLNAHGSSPLFVLGCGLGIVYFGLKKENPICCILIPEVVG